MGLISQSSRERGFTLVEMIVVIVITGIIGGIVAVFIRAPVQGYVDSARRAEMSDIADTALHRITRDLRLALPNSVRVTSVACGASTCSYLELLPTGSPSCPANTVCLGGGRYRAGTGGGAGCAASPSGEELDFTVADGCFGVLGTMPPFAAGDQVVVYNLGVAGADAYAGNNRTAWSSTAGSVVNITPKLFPFDSPNHRFHVISTPVTYVCNPVTGGGGTLTRYWGYAIQAAQPSNTAAAPLSTASHALLASNVSACSFTYDPLVSARNGLVTLNLGITESGETVALYNAAHVSNTP
ncbi:MAG TPA: prepilin-type N-terminal cleavage/methylation domain-containing protein [Gallionella sp.]|nr:prepilin-type N-terminal cleavage/methylation domain-containing protein [Gallionella sp.]